MSKLFEDIYKEYGNNGSVNTTPKPAANTKKQSSSSGLFDELYSEYGGGTTAPTNTPAATPAPAPTGNVDLSNLDNITNNAIPQPSLWDSAVEYAKNVYNPAKNLLTGSLGSLANSSARRRELASFLA